MRNKIIATSKKKYCMKTFKDCYKEVSTMSPKKMWIQRIAKVTHRSEATVRMWLSGRQVPEVLIQEIIANELGVPVEGLFPNEEEI